MTFVILLIQRKLTKYPYDALGWYLPLRIPPELHFLTYLLSFVGQDNEHKLRRLGWIVKFGKVVQTLQTRMTLSTSSPHIR